MNLTELIRAVIDQHICTCQASEDNKRLLTKAIVNVIPKREHGEWIQKCIYGDRFCECSVCRSQTYQISPLYEFCPHCGADMRVLTYTAKEPTDDCVAIEFSADANEPNKWQSKDGEWHTGKIPTKTESEENK